MGQWQNNLYAKLPIFAQNFAITAFGYKWNKRRFGGVFAEELIRFKKRESYTAQQWHDYQTIELRKLLLHAIETVPFYREKYSKAGFNAEVFKRFELDDLSKLPFLEKEELRRYGTSTLLSANREKQGAFFQVAEAQVHLPKFYFLLTFINGGVLLSRLE